MKNSASVSTIWRTIGVGSKLDADSQLEALDQIAFGRSPLHTFAQSLGLDPKDLDLDKAFPEHLIPQVAGSSWLRRSSGHVEARLRLLRERSMTVRQIIAQGGGGHYRLVGTPEQIADFMIEWQDADAADGFNLFFDVYPEGLLLLAEHVVPILQRRGRYRMAYEGRTLRDHYGLERPANLFTGKTALSTKPRAQAAD
jgi:alkanesulfonate monooxygenase SsuD/methylene tetrahydromethanopterin reductase-like flavin-dependent oxidoreductase (luciferase family)